MDVLVLRDPREPKAKCSLTPLSGMPGVRILSFHPQHRLQAGGRILLHCEGEELTGEDRGRDLLLIDCAWRRVPRLLDSVDGELFPRRLPPLRSAYPRRSKISPDPLGGLASVEALFAASVLLGEPRPDFLHGYRWRKEFLLANPGLAPDTALP